MELTMAVESEVTSVREPAVDGGRVRVPAAKPGWVLKLCLWLWVKASALIFPEVNLGIPEHHANA